MPEVRAYYDARGESEWHRLENPYEGLIEGEIHRRALVELLPSGARVLDLGGGPGRWTIWLARRGHRVVLGDISPALLEIARRELLEAGLEAEAIEEMDARDLARFGDREFDAVLALGPFYHLVDLAERMRAAREVVRVLRPGGVLAASVMVRYAWAIELVLEGGSARAAEAKAVVETGAYAAGDGANFTQAYLHHPQEVAAFFETAGFETIRLLASEGLLEMVQERVAELRERDEAAFEALIDIAYSAADDPAVLGLSGHLLYCGRAPQDP